MKKKSSKGKLSENEMYLFDHNHLVLPRKGSTFNLKTFTKRMKVITMKV